MYFITTKRMLEVCFSAHPNIQYRTLFCFEISLSNPPHFCKERKKDLWNPNRNSQDCMNHVLSMITAASAQWPI